MQDKERVARDRRALQQPAPQENTLRSHLLSKNLSRLQNNHTPKRKTIHLTLWFKPRVKEELQRIAVEEGISLSAAGGAFLERALQQRVDMQYGALLGPVIERCIAKEMKSISTRLAWLLVRVAFDTGQMRGMMTNILGRQNGMNQEIFMRILKESSNTAKANITRKTPQLEELMEVLEKWLQEVEKEKV